ncbi:MAG: S41 family peptidase [Fimbriimonadaceae bacterium]|nr:S41 family peptidase [Fimbriimonadaceae bacterium]
MLCALLLPLFVEDAPFLRTPDVHGDKVVFTCEGDLWLGSISKLEAVRLTRHEGTEMDARFSPDGSKIAFTAEYDGVREAYVMPTAGGVPKRITYRHDYAFVQDWTPDGKSVLLRARSLPRSFGLYQVPADGGPESKLPIEFASHAAYAPNGQLVFTRFYRASDAWFHYKGGMQNQIWTADLGAKRFKQITNVDGTNEYPVAAAGHAVFANERDGTFRLLAVPLAGGAPKPLGSASDVEIRELAGDDAHVVYERGRGIEMADPATGKITPLPFRLVSDRMHMVPFHTDPEPIGAYAISPTGKRVYAEARGQILDLPVGDGESRVWKRQDGARLRLPKPSPDGKSLAYTSDASGEQQLVVANIDGSGEHALTTDAKRQLVDFRWSPDSKWILLYDSEMRLRLVDAATGQDRVIHQEILSWGPTPTSFSPDSKWIALTQTDPISNQTNLALYEIATAKTTVLGHPLAYDTAPAFSSDGKYLAFLSRRTFSAVDDAILNQLNTEPATQIMLMLLSAKEKNPLALKDPVEGAEKPEEKSDKAKEVEVAIDFDGLYERSIALPLKPGKYTQVAMVGSKVIFADDEAVASYDLGAKAPATITPGTTFELSADGKKLLVRNRVVDVAGKDLPPTAGALKTNGLTLLIDPASEWKQMYWDAWRLLRDYFYVPNMNGVDWPAIGKKYATYLDSVRSRDELDILIRWMQSELGSSHEYLQPGDERELLKPVAGGFLGIDTEPDPSGKLRLTKVIRGDGLREDERSPLAVAGIDAKEGEFLLAVAGQPLDARSDYRAALVGRAGQIVSVVLNDKPTLEGARTVFVKPIGNETRMRRLEWVEQNRRYVEKASGGKVGYLYLAAMSGPDVEDFIRQFYPQRNKEALIVDTRFNNGGYTQNTINKILSEKLTGFFNMRASSASWTRNGDYFLGPKVCITNEFNVSCGEEFPHRFRDLGLGPIIGRRTYGGEVGSSPGWPLADGGVVSVPNYGMWTPKDGWVIEGPGVSPDIDVPSDPNAFAIGKDPQLDKSVEWLLDDLKRHPVVQPKQPADPIRIRRGGG